jgi:hypothetical protein
MGSFLDDTIVCQASTSVSYDPYEVTKITNFTGSTTWSDGIGSGVNHYILLGTLPSSDMSLTGELTLQTVISGTANGRTYKKSFAAHRQSSTISVGETNFDTGTPYDTSHFQGNITWGIVKNGNDIYLLIANSSTGTSGIRFTLKVEGAITS